MHSFLALKTALPSLSLSEPSNHPVAEVDDYLRFYQLDTLPGRHSIGWVTSASQKLAVQCWRVEQAVGTVLVVHGYYDHCGLYGHLIRFWLTQRYNVVAFDLPGHGLSDGPRAAINSFDEYGAAISAVLHACQPHLPAPWLACGQSTGCAALLNLLMSGREHPLQRLILLAPLLRPHRWARSGRWTYLALHRWIKNLPRHFNNNSSDAAFVTFCRTRDPLQARYLNVSWVTAMKDWLDHFDEQPVQTIDCLMIQGERDDTVDWRYNIPHILKKLPHAELHYLSEARHHLANENTAIRAHLWQIIAAYLSQPTSNIR